MGAYTALTFRPEVRQETHPFLAYTHKRQTGCDNKRSQLYLSSVKGYLPHGWGIAISSLLQELVPGTSTRKTKQKLKQLVNVQYCQHTW